MQEEKEAVQDVVVVYGSTGWIGEKVVGLIRQQKCLLGAYLVQGSARVEHLRDIATELKAVNEGSHKDMRERGKGRVRWVVNCAGATGRPNVDWCEKHKEETAKANLLGPLNVVLAAREVDEAIHVTYFGTGCIYSYDESHPQPETGREVGEADGFGEQEQPNFAGSFYSLTKGVADTVLERLGGSVLVLRLRMPISDDLHPRSLVTKLLGYAKVVNVPNSMSVLHDLLPIAMDMTENGVTGVFNFTNPGAVSHNELLQMYKDIVDERVTWENFDMQEHDKVVAAPRSNNTLATSKLRELYPSVPSVHEALAAAFIRMAAKNKQQT